MSPKYRLTYFNVNGRGDTIRMLFFYGGIEFEDSRVDFEDWPKLKPSTPLGELPILEVEGIPYTQTISISKYVGNVVGLNGGNVLENLVIDSAVQIIMDLLMVACEHSFEKDEARKSIAGEKLNNLLRLLDADVKKNGYVALDRLTWADIFYLCTFEDLRNVNVNFTEYANLEGLKNKLLKIEKIRNYISKRPNGHPSHPYDLKNDL